MNPQAPAAPGGEAAPAAPAPVAPAPAPAAPVAPAPSAPVAPGSEPVAPATPAPAAQPAPAKTPEETAAEADDAEWDSAHHEAFPGLSSTQKKEPSKNEPAKPKEGEEEAPATPPNPDEKKPDAEPKPGDDTKPKGSEDEGAGAKPNEATDADAAARAARAATRQSEQQVTAYRNDIREKVFANIPQTLQDADGDPINSVEDVMKLINPRTLGDPDHPNGRTFTEEEAGIWLLSAQQKFNEEHAQIEKQVERIADLNMDIKDQADVVNGKYGEYLKAHTDIRDSLWAEYQKTLVTDPESGVIVQAPIGLGWFYEQVLGPRVAAEQKAAEDAAAATAAQEAEAAKAKAEEEAARQKRRGDRSDLYGGQQPDTTDPEDAEWGQAIEATYPHLAKK